jgi:hypothetical protein
MPRVVHDIAVAGDDFEGRGLVGRGRCRLQQCNGRRHARGEICGELGRVAFVERRYYDFRPQFAL